MKRIFLFVFFLVGLDPSADVFAEETGSVESTPAPSHNLGFRPTVSLGVPHLINIGSHLIQTPDWDWTIQAGGFGFSFSAGKSILLWNIETGFRFHPWSIGFFFGGILRYSQISFRFALPQVDATAGAQPEVARILLAGFSLSPQLGWRWWVGEKTWIAMSLGLQFPLINGGSFKIVEHDPSVESAEGIANLETSASRVADYYATMTIPSLTLFELGWEF